MAESTRSRDEPAPEDVVAPKPKRLRGVIAAFLAALVIIVVTALVTTIAVDAIHGRTNPVVQAASGKADEANAVEQARAEGYKSGVRDTRQQAKDQLAARYDQGFAKGYAKGRNDAETNTGETGGYEDGFNAGVKSAVDAYEKIIAQAQAIIAEAKQAPVTTVPAVP